MGQSKYSKKTMALRRIAAGVVAGGAQIRLPLNRDWLIAEHRVNVVATQTFAGGAPTSVDVRDFIDTISVETSDGRRIFLSGAQAYDLGRFTENAANVVLSALTTGVNTASFNIDLHYENDEALLDLACALRSNELTTLDLVITAAAGTSTINGFKGGTTATPLSLAIAVESEEFEMLTEKPFGVALGSFKHFAEKQEYPGTTVGTQPDFQLVTGNNTRFVGIHAYDTTGAAPVLSDAIVGNLRININGRDYRLTDFAAVRRDNTAARNFNQVGVAYIDFGDDEAGFLNLTGVNQAKLTWDVKVGAPASYVVKITQDYTRQ